MGFTQRGCLFEWDREFESLGLEREETHISKVYLGKRDAWKIKKPIDFGYPYRSAPEKGRGRIFHNP